MAVTHKELSAGVLGWLRARGSSHRGRVTFQSEARGHPGGEEGKGTPRRRFTPLSAATDSLVMDLRRPAATWFLRLRICLVDSGYAKQAGSKWLKYDYLGYS